MTPSYAYKPNRKRMASKLTFPREPALELQFVELPDDGRLGRTTGFLGAHTADHCLLRSVHCAGVVIGPKTHARGSDAVESRRIRWRSREPCWSNTKYPRYWDDLPPERRIPFGEECRKNGIARGVLGG